MLMKWMLLRLSAVDIQVLDILYLWYTSLYFSTIIGLQLPVSIDYKTGNAEWDINLSYKTSICIFSLTDLCSTLLSRCLVSVPEDSKHTSKIVTSLTSVLSSLYENQRVTVAAFFAEVALLIILCVLLYSCMNTT